MGEGQQQETDGLIIAMTKTVRSEKLALNISAWIAEKEEKKIKEKKKTYIQPKLQ